MPDTVLGNWQGALPEKVGRLPRDERGYPIPWFVARTPAGAYDIRVACPEKRVKAYREELCWVCGGRLRPLRVFVGGPLSFLNRVFGDWASHEACATLAALACPALNGKLKRRRSADGVTLPDGSESVSMFGNQPELTDLVCLYGATGEVKLERSTGLFLPKGPRWARWYRDGRPATAAEVAESLAAARARIERAKAEWLRKRQAEGRVSG